MIKKNCCVFLGANNPRNPNHIQAISTLCEQLAKHQLKLIYGGSQNGLMGTLADTALKNGIPTTGIMSEDLLHMETVHPELNEIIYTQTIAERKLLMIEKSELFIVMPGGVGTLEELFTAWCSIKIHGQTKKIAVANIDNYYDDLENMIDLMLSNSYVEPQHRDIVYIGSDFEELFNAMLCPPDAGA